MDARQLTAQAIMTSRVCAVSATAPVDNAVSQLLRLGYSGAPVLDDGRVVGLLSEHDCIRALNQALHDHAPTGAVADFMTREVATVSPDETLEGVAQRFVAGKYRRLMVVDEGDRLMGLIGRRDLLRALQSALEPEHPSTPEILRHLWSYKPRPTGEGDS